MRPGRIVIVKFLKFFPKIFFQKRGSTSNFQIFSGKFLFQKSGQRPFFWFFFRKNFCYGIVPPSQTKKYPLYNRGYRQGGGGRITPTLSLTKTFSTHAPFNTFGGCQFSVTFTAPTLVPYFSTAVNSSVKQSAIYKAKGKGGG